MSVVANIAVNVDATKAISQLKAVEAAASGASSKTGGLGSAFGNLNSAIAGLGLGALTASIAGVGIDADRTQIRIRNLADANGETAKVFDVAAKAAKEFGLGSLSAEKGMADLYGRLRPAGIGLKDIETTFNGVNKAALAAGLTTADTEGVFLQLAQAMGSGKLQGDELRSIMERMPAVGQAVAKVMGVTVGEIKQLGADGLITTEVMIKAAEELNKLKPPPPDAFRQFNAAMEDLRVEFGENMLPILLPFVNGLLAVVKAFGALPEPIQTVIVALGLVVTAILAIGSAAAILGPVITGFGTLMTAIGAANIGGLIAGWLPVFSGVLTWIGSTFIPGLLAFFTGPVGWTVLAVAAVIAMITLFQEPLGDFISWLWDWGEPIRQFWADLWGNVSTFAADAFNAVIEVADAYLLQPLLAVWESISGPLEGVLEGIKGLFEWYMAAAWAVFDTLLLTPLKTAWDALVSIVDGALGAIANAAGSAWQAISDAFNTYVAQPLITAWSTTIEFLEQALQPVVETITGTWQALSDAFNTYVAEPITKAWESVTGLLTDAMESAAATVTGIWNGVINSITSAVNSALNYIAGAINNVAALVNNLIRGFNALPGADIPLIPMVSFPAFADGGVVNGPTLAMVGEGGEPEYIIPASKMAQASANYLSGARGGAVIPAYANGGFVGSGAQINVTTGPVLQQDGQQYVTITDLEKAMQKTAAGVYASLRTSAGRYATGVR